MDTDAFWIILTGILVAGSGGLLGCFLLLRQMSMVGDAISHAVLPGIVIAYLLSGSNAPLLMLIGAAAFGIIVTLLIESLHKIAKMQADAAIGISYTWLFAVGVILISAFGGNVDLDQECVLFGEISYVPLQLWLTDKGNSMGPLYIWLLGANFLLVLLFISLGYKALFITSFDPLLAASLGISTGIWHYGLMAAVSLTTVFSFESVGAILVVAFLVGPAATAFLLTHKLKKMLFLSVLIGALASVLGYFLAKQADASIAGGMTIAIGLIFLLAFTAHLYKKKQKKQAYYLPSFFPLGQSKK